MASRGKLNTQQRDLIKQLVAAGLPPVEIAEQVTQHTGKKTTAHQVNGYKNVLTGIAGSRPGAPPKVEVIAGSQPMPVLPPPPVPPVLQPRPAAAVVSPEGFTNPSSGIRPGGDGFAGPASRVSYEFDVYRKEPNHGFLGRVKTDAFGPDQLAEKFGDGLYDIYKLANGRVLPNGIYTDQRVSGHGPPRYLNGQVAAMGPGGASHVMMESPYGNGRYGAYSPYGYGPLGPTSVMGADPSTQLRNVVDVADRIAARMTPSTDPAKSHIDAVQASLGFAQGIINGQKENGHAASDWFQKWMMQEAQARREDRDAEAARREQERKDLVAQRKHELELLEAKAKLDRDKMKEEFDRQRDREKEEHTRRLQDAKDEEERRKDRDREYHLRVQEIQDKRDEMVREKLEDLKAIPDAVQQELDQKVKFTEDHFKQLYDLQKDGLKDRREMQDRMYQLQKEHLDRQKGDGLIAETIKGSVEKISGSFDRALLVKTMREMSGEERRDIVQLLSQMNGGNARIPGTNGTEIGAGGAKPNGETPMADGDFTRDAVQKVLASDFFQQLQEEWALHVASGNGPYMFTRTFITFMNRSPNMVLFGTYMIVRPWKTLIETMKPHLKKEVADVFAKPEAQTFFDQFKKLLNDNMRVQVEYASKQIAASNGGAAPAPAPEGAGHPQ